MTEHQALYRKYRSKSLDEIVGQEHITKTLSNALKKGRISHAYLLTGPHGVGKTSVARILAHEINELPYTSGQENLDIIEIDAASNRRIDEIRDLRDKVRIAPTSSKYKVYIIDEVHMLTKEAFNALLKTLEEPPEHVVFILATTEFHKLPETIISRTQRHTFLPISKANLSSHIKQIAKKENIKISDSAVNLLAKHSFGSFRDGISLLDQTANMSEDEITDVDVRNALGIADEDIIERIITTAESGKPADLLDLVEEAMALGVTPSAISEQCINTLKENGLQGRHIKLIENLLDVPVSFNPQLKLETALVSYNLTQNGEQEPKMKATKIQNTVDVIRKPEQTAETKPEPSEEKPAKPETPPIKQPSAAPQPFSNKSWSEILKVMKTKYNSLYAILRMAQVEDDGEGNIKLIFKFSFHQKRISEQKNMTIIQEAASEVLGQSVTIVPEQSDEVSPTASKVSDLNEPSSAPVSSVIDIMGGGEVVNIQ